MRVRFGVPLLLGLALLGVSVPVSADLSVDTKRVLSNINDEYLFYTYMDLTFEEFYWTYSSDKVQVRRSANNYLYGIMDATDGKDWCGFDKIRPSEIIGTLHGEFKKVDKSRYNERAAHIIIELLHSCFKCKGRQ